MENTEVYNDETDGVLRLKLEENAYEWRFVPVEGKSFTDSGSTGCH
jgi:acid phosphatase type 7